MHMHECQNMHTHVATVYCQSVRVHAGLQREWCIATCTGAPYLLVSVRVRTFSSDWWQSQQTSEFV